MPRARFDDQSAFHPKICAAGNAAVGLWFRMTCYCNAQLTDGFVAESVARLMGSRKELESVVTGNLAHKVDGGYQVHDFLDHNPSAEEVKAYRDELSKKRQEAGRQGGIKSGKARTNQEPTNGEAKSKQVASIASKQNEALSVSYPILSDPKEREDSLSRVGEISRSWAKAGLPPNGNAYELGQLAEEIDAARKAAADAGVAEIPSDDAICVALKRITDDWAKAQKTTKFQPSRLRTAVGQAIQIARGKATTKPNRPPLASAVGYADEQGDEP